MSQNTYSRRHVAPSIDDAITLVGAGQINGVHKACRDVPKIAHRDFDQLVDSIAKHGLLRVIEVDHDRRLVDGRSRIQALAVLGIELTPKDIVVTDVDPHVIAASNNARRHLTIDQKAAEAVRLLAVERKNAAERKREGAAKGRRSKQSSLGTDFVPSDVEPKKRRPRAIDAVAAETGVSRDMLATAEKVLKAAPELSIKVEKGEMSLEDAATQAQVPTAKRTKPVVTKRTAKVDESQASSETTSATSSTVWQDEFTKVTDSRGIRMIRCSGATLFIDKNSNRVGLVIPDGDKWWWYAGTEEEQACVNRREDGEKLVLKSIKDASRITS